MRKQMTQSSVSNKDVKDVRANNVKSKVTSRIDEEGLFNLFTADIMKMKIKFTR